MSILFNSFCLRRGPDIRARRLLWPLAQRCADIMRFNTEKPESAPSYNHQGMLFVAVVWLVFYTVVIPLVPVNSFSHRKSFGATTTMRTTMHPASTTLRKFVPTDRIRSDQTPQSL